MKHGVENHVREILFECPTRLDASNKERELITPDILSDPNCLNCGMGGLGATDRPATSVETSAKLSKASKRYVRTKEWYEKIVESRKKNGTNTHSEETKKLLAQKQVGKKLSEEHREKIAKGLSGRVVSENTRSKLKEAWENRRGKPINRKPTSDKFREAIRKSRIGKKHSEQAKANMRKSKDMSKNKRKCTVDGVLIFDSVKDMVKALGSGKNSRRSPDFRYVS